MCERLGEGPHAPDRTRRSILAALAGLGLFGCAVRRTRRVSCVPRREAPISPYVPDTIYPKTVYPSAGYDDGHATPPVVVSYPDVTSPIVESAPDAAKREPWEFVTRAEWGASDLRDNHDPMTPIERLTLHHTDTLDVVKDKSDAEFVKAVQELHQDKRGWADIGYHYLIGRDGKVYEGRRIDVQGAHAGAGNNGGNLGISVIGNFEEALPGKAQLATLQAFLAHQVGVHALKVEGLLAHRDLKATECPGDALYAWYGTKKPTLGTSG